MKVAHMDGLTLFQRRREARPITDAISTALGEETTPRLRAIRGNSLKDWATRRISSCYEL
jgi:hypothetical protein